MADQDPQRKQDSDPDTTADVYLPEDIYKRFQELEAASPGAFNQLILDMFPENERFGLTFVQLHPKTPSAKQAQGGYKKTCGST